MTDIMSSRRLPASSNQPLAHRETAKHSIFPKLWAIHLWLAEPLRRRIQSELYLLFGGNLLIGWLLLSPADIGFSLYTVMGVMWPLSLIVGIFRSRSVIKRSISR